MIIKRLGFIFLLFYLFFGSCTEAPFKGKFPFAVTGITASKTDQDVTFFGNIVLAEGVKPIDYGFVWGENLLPTLGDYSQHFGKSPVDGVYSSSINYDLIPDTRLYVRTFLLMKNEVIYGESQAFDSKGCPSPKLTDIEPKTTKGNDTITITGQFLTSKISDIVIEYKIDLLGYNYSAKATVLEANPGYIKFRLSNGIIPFYARILLSVKLRNTEIFSQANMGTPLQLTEGPQISGFNPKFTSRRAFVKMKINNLKGTIQNIFFFSQYGSTTWDYRYFTNSFKVVNDSIQFQLPVLDYGVYKIGIICGDQNRSYVNNNDDLLTIMPPEIVTTLEKSPFVGDSVTLIGKYFDPYYNLTLNDDQYSIYTSISLRGRYITPTSLKFVIPTNLFEKEYKICFLDGNPIFPTYSIFPRSNWTIRKELPTSQGTTFNLSLPYQGKIILGLPVNNSSPIDNINQLWIYDIGANQFSNLTLSISKSYYGPVTFITDNQLYLAGGLDYSNRDLSYDSYKFDIVNNLWSNLAQYNAPVPKDMDDVASTCVMGSKVYLKRLFNKGIYWSDTQNISWKYLNEFPEVATDTEDKMILLQDNSNLYLVFLDYTMYSPIHVKLYQLNLATNTWIKKQDTAIEDFYGFNAFIENNNLWLAGYPSLYKYSLEGILLKKFANLGTNSNLCYFYNSKLYAISSSLNKMIEFDPNKN